MLRIGHGLITTDSVRNQKDKAEGSKLIVHIGGNIISTVRHPLQRQITFKHIANRLLQSQQQQS